MTKEKREASKKLHAESINQLIHDAVELTDVSGWPITTQNVVRTLYDVMDRIKAGHESINLESYLD